MPKNTSLSLHKSILRLSRIHFLYIFAFAVSIIVYDASQLIAPEAVLDRWKYTAALLIVVTAVWYSTRLRKESASFQKWLVTIIVFSDILFASLLVYADRGMASLAVALFALPIASAGVLMSRSAVLAAASLSTVGYALACIKYFVDFFNEGYKVQLYSSIGFYGASFFALALILVVIMDQSKDTSVPKM